MELRDVTAEEVQNSITTNHIGFIHHHECVACKGNTKWVFNGEAVFYNPSCKCASESPRNRTWADVAKWVNDQTSEEWKKEYAKRCGIFLEETSGQ